LQDPPKFTQIGIFGLKTNHLATLPYGELVWIKFYPIRHTLLVPGKIGKKNSTLEVVQT
jgi:hypothetical protein